MKALWMASLAIVACSSSNGSREVENETACPQLDVIVLDVEPGVDCVTFPSGSVVTVDFHGGTIVSGSAMWSGCSAMSVVGGPSNEPQGCTLTCPTENSVAPGAGVPLPGQTGFGPAFVRGAGNCVSEATTP